MAKLLKLRRGTTTQHGSFTGAEGEVTVDTDKETLVVHDGSTAGGHPVAAEDMANVSSASIAGRLGTDSIATSKIAGGALPTDVTVANANVTANAAIAGTKISPDFGSQNVVTTGTLGSGNITVTNADPRIRLVDSDHNSDFSVYGNGGAFTISDDTNSANRFQIASDGTISSLTNHDFSAGIDVTGNITVSGTVDGRDVAADGTKLDGIESGATADQTASEIVALVAGQNIAPATVYATGNIGKDSGDFISFTTDTQMDVTINGNNEFRFEADGDFHADGDVIAQSTTTASDIRLKENIEPVSDALKKVQALNGVSFDWKKTGERSAGVIAQEVIGVLPEAVKEVTPVGGGDSHLTVNYHALTSILIEAIKELKAELDEHKGGK